MVEETEVRFERAKSGTVAASCGRDRIRLTSAEYQGAENDATFRRRQTVVRTLRYHELEVIHKHHQSALKQKT